MIYEIKNFSGLSDYEDKGIVGAFKFGANLDVRKAIDSLSSGQALKEEGINAGFSPSRSTSLSPSVTESASVSLSPSVSVSASQSASTGISPSPSTTPSASISRSPSVTPSASVSASPSPSAGLTTVFQDLIHFFVKSTNGYTYGFGNTGTIYRRDLDGYWIRVYKDAGAIVGAAEWYSQTGKTYLYWATRTKLYRKVLPGLSNWNDVEFIGTLSNQNWHTMKVSGGSLVIANGEKLALVGYDSSFTDEAVNLIPGNIAVTIVERNGRAIAGCARKSDPSRSVNAAIDAEVPLAQVGNDGEIFFANMTDTIPVKRFPGGGKCNPGGVCNEISQVNFFEWEQTALSWIDKQSVGNMALFGVYGATSGKNGIYSYGRRNKNKPFVLNLEYAMDVDEIGAVENVEGTTIASYRSGSSFGVRAVDKNNKAIGTYEGLDFKSPMKLPVDITNWKYVELFFSPLPSGTSIEFWYRMNKSGNFIKASTANNQTSFSTANSKKAVFTIGAEGEIYEPKIVLNPSGNYTPEIHRIRTYFN